MELSLDDVDPGWAQALEPLAPELAALSSFLTEEEKEGRLYLPADENILRAFIYPMDAVRVLIVGQDPYPTPGHPIGLSFALDRHVHRLPGSLKNIYRELRDDLGLVTPDHGDLTPWAENGVMLLNRVLTVRAGPRMAGSHSRKGWEQITDAAIRALVARGTPLVAILWGNKAQSLASQLGSTPIVASPHPSDLSASRGFFGSRPFSRANEALLHLKAEPVDWSLN